MPGGLPGNAQHIACDFLKSPDEIGKVLKDNNVGGENVYVFFFAYLQPPPKEGKGLWSDAQEMVRVNSALLDNFIGGMRVAGVHPKRFMLQTGAKNYGTFTCCGPCNAPFFTLMCTCKEFDGPRAGCWQADSDPRLG